MRRSSSPSESPVASALRKLRDAGDRILGGSHFTAAEQVVLWELKVQGRVEIVERDASGFSGWRLVARTPGGASLTRDA